MQFFTHAIALAAAAASFFASAAPISARQEAGNFIPGKYIIQLKPETDVASIAAHHTVVREIYARNLAKRDVTVAEEEAGVEHEYSFGDFKGYAGAFDAATIEEVKSLPEVLEVEQDQTMTATGLVIQNPSSWGLASISSRTPGASGYVFDNAGTHATFSYVLDTGIRLTHQDFGGRAQFGANYAGDGDNDDANGHGTHVAGIIGGQTYGVAKKTTLISVKVLNKNGSGANSGILAGINYVVSTVSSKGQSGSAVINMSLSGAASSALDSAVANAVSAGIPVVVAAGNDNRSASLYSPARAPSAICVASIQSDDARSSFSNWGADVDIFAPGSSVPSAYIGSDTATATLSGTSMAAPHVAGLVSYIRGLEGPSSSATVRARLLEYAVAGRVKDTQGSPNLVAYNGNGGR